MRIYTLKNTGEQVKETDKKLWDVVAEGYGFKTSDFGKSFFNPEDGNTYKIVGVRPNLKRPILVESINGSRWTYSVQLVKKFEIENSSVTSYL